MRLRLKFLALAVACFPFFSCNKETGKESSPVSTPIRLVVGVESGSGTKATGVTSNDASTEAKVNSLQVFVFNGDALDGYAASTNKLATVTCTSGSREVVAVVNAPSLASVTTKSGLLASVSTLENNISNFQMIGSKTETLQHDGNVTVGVDRLAARVVLRGVKNSLENPTQAASFRLVSVYLTNVTGDVNYGKSATYTATKWYNRRGYESTNSLGSFDYDAVDAVVAAGATNSTEHYFYSMPNNKDDILGIEPGASGYTPRRARLVILAEIDGELYHYPILLPVLESNKSYEINLVNLTRAGNRDDGNDDPDDPGNNDDEKPIEKFDQGFEISVNDWTVVLVNGDGNVTI